MTGVSKNCWVLKLKGKTIFPLLEDIFEIEEPEARHENYVGRD